MVRRVDRKRSSHWSGVPDIIGLGRKGVKKDEEAGKNEIWPIEILSMKGLRGPSPLSFWCRR